ncbi:MAG: hypothetical protein AAF899_00725 [Pseudomonadota bacterium]
MTDTVTAAPATPLGVGAIISETFSIFARCFVPCMIAILGPSLVVFALSLVLVGAPITDFDDPGAIAGPGFGDVIVNILSLLAASLSIAIVVRIVYDTKLGKQPNFGAAVRSAVPHLAPIFVLSIAFYLAIVVGLIALVVPALWIMAALGVYAPAIVVENAGFRGLGRSFELTKGYRWPIVGVALVLGIIYLIALSVVGGLFVALASTLGIIAMLLLTIIIAVPQALLSVAPVLIYARLREIKDGLGVEDVASVFE